MAFYTLSDIESTDDGDLVLDSIGDFKVATPLRTVAQAINNIILTNKGELLMEPSFGANLQQFKGHLNTQEIRSLMEKNIEVEVEKQGLIDRRDFSVDAVAVDINTVGIITTIRGVFPDVETTGAFGGILEIDQGLDMAYVYPFNGGPLTPLSGVSELSYNSF
jgi:hypothetical protein